MKIAKTSFAVPSSVYSGRVVREGMSFDDDAAVVKAFPSMFLTPDDYAADRAPVTAVERMTAAPGEKRTVKPKTKKPAAEK